MESGRRVQMALAGRGPQPRPRARRKSRYYRTCRVNSPRSERRNNIKEKSRQVCAPGRPQPHARTLKARRSKCRTAPRDPVQGGGGGGRLCAGRAALSRPAGHAALPWAPTSPGRLHPRSSVPVNAWVLSPPPRANSLAPRGGERRTGPRAAQGPPSLQRNGADSQEQRPAPALPRPRLSNPPWKCLLGYFLPQVHKTDLNQL